MRQHTLHRRGLQGFTLIELLIAITIFAIIGVMALGGYNELIKQRERGDATMARVRALQLTMTRLAQDFEQAEPRPIRDGTAATARAAFLVDATTTYLVEFTHAGWTNPAGVQRSTLQRVAYRVADGKLYRDYWTVLDRTLTNMPVDVALLDKVSSMTLRFMDQNRQWQTTWPATATGGGNRRSMPMAVEITLQLEDWGEIKRLVELP